MKPIIDGVITHPIDLATAAKDLGPTLATSGMFGLDKEEQGVALAWHLLLTGQSPIDFSRKWRMPGGKLTMRADATLAEYKARGGKCTWLSKLDDANEAKARFVYLENDLEAAYSMADAKREGSAGKQQYQAFGPDMLRARLIVKVLRMICPEAVSGAYLPGDEEDAPTAPAATLQFPAPAVTPPAAAPDTESELAAAGLAPITPAPAEAKPAPAPDPTPKPAQAPEPAPETPRTPRDEFEAICEATDGKALPWMAAKGWIAPGQTLADVPDGKIKMVLSRPLDWVKTVKAS